MESGMGRRIRMRIPSAALNETKSEDAMEFCFRIDRGLRVNMIGHSVCGPDWSLRGRTLGDMELLVVYVGTVRCEIDHVDYILREGEGCLVPPGVPVSQYSHEGPCRFFYVHFETEREDLDAGRKAALMRQLRNRTAARAPDFFILPPMREEDGLLLLGTRVSVGEHRDEIFTLFEKALLERNRPSFGQLLILSLYAGQILTLIARSGMQPAEAGTPRETREQKRLVQEALGHIHSRYAGSIDIRALAGSLHVSQQYLTRLFKASVGMPPVRYVNKVRVAHAKELIRTTHDNLSHIAFQTGFENIYYFSRIFRQFEGMSPSGYRQWLDSRSNQGETADMGM